MEVVTLARLLRLLTSRSAWRYALHLLFHGLAGEGVLGGHWLGLWGLESNFVVVLAVWGLHQASVSHLAREIPDDGKPRISFNETTRGVKKFLSYLKKNDHFFHFENSFLCSQCWGNSQHSSSKTLLNNSRAIVKKVLFYGFSVKSRVCQYAATYTVVLTKNRWRR